jgi:nitroimidazol reductase NimA-like FMN-containing flavoprotein (pyridoxamine 5'-phosphate oxidase superfamily)
MRRKDKEITDNHIIEDILSNSGIVRIALNSQPVPYIVPLNYGYKNKELYIHTSRMGRKIDLIKANPMVAFEVENHAEIIKKDISCEWTTKYRSVMGIAKIEILTEKEDIIKGLDIIMQHFGKMQNQYDEKYFQRIVVLKLSIVELSAKQSGDWV